MTHPTNPVASLAAEWNYPMCGSCAAETEHDGDYFYCGGCGLDFDPGDLQASYRDEDAKPCDAPCGNTYHQASPAFPYDCAPCALPSGHTTEDHWNPCVLKGDR